MGKVTDEQKTAALVDMQQTFAGRDGFGMKINDRTITRYLVARNWDVTKASKLLEATLKWRESFGLKDMYAGKWSTVLENENETGKMYCRGYDKHGHPVIYMTPQYENTHDHDGNLKHLVYNIERAVRAMDNSPNPDCDGKMALIIDYEGFSLWNAPPMKTSRETLNILQDHYPERLHRAYLLRPPMIFHGFWSMISPFIDSVTREKVKFLKSDETKLIEQILNDFSLDHIEKRIGGKDERKFVSCDYLKQDYGQTF